MTLMSESAAPKVGIVDTVVSMDVDLPASASGVLYALGGFSGGLTVYVKEGVVTYEYNQFIVQRTKIRSTGKLPVGKARIEVASKLATKVGGAMDITIKVDDKVVAQGQVPTAISLHFTTNESFDIGSDTSSPVSLDYYDKAPFAFNGKIGQTVVKYPKK
jgi:arylsulfatase